MIILIDAYNILKYTGKALHVSEDQRKAFIREVARYAATKHHEAVIVFDGGSYDYPAFFKEDGVTVVYSGQRMTADDVIKSLIIRYEAQNQAESVVVVSSDRDVQVYAKQYKALPINAQEFYNFIRTVTQTSLVRVVKSTEAPQKMANYESTPELDVLMERASSWVVIKDIESELPRASQKFSKKDKKLHKLVKKL